jgi:hypothetical protein
MDALNGDNEGAKQYCRYVRIRRAGPSDVPEAFLAARRALARHQPVNRHGIFTPVEG